MKKSLHLSLLLVFVTSLSFSQDVADQINDTIPDGWRFSGSASLLLSQAAFNKEWQAGGTSNIAVELSGVQQIDYKNGPWVWDNTIWADYGKTRFKDSEFDQKTNDRLEFTSTVGRRIKQTNWYASFFLNFRTQFDKGFEDTDTEFLVPNPENPDQLIPVEVTTRELETKFMSPGYLQFGPGMLWKKSENLKVNIAPASARFVFAASQFTDPNNPGNQLDGDMRYFGIDAGDTSRFEFGASIQATANFQLIENVLMRNQLNLYSNYLEDPQNVDIDYTMNLIMSVNSWLSANFIFQAIYDDNAARGFQIREVLSVGLTFGY
ncbi:DUF3078 domain-containing protein [Aureitalea marina]|uniref:DUF3078 domain-containing protein n=1 Tax=Aureitalea marina TaxID=930804 RepID=A0A2S7KSL6_9FLAO|nr:DUF3078 domain-containing protein [Aureitalea marina]PQB05621.1 hypothetical protein BST85_12475 [Aureitalea marina]